MINNLKINLKELIDSGEAPSWMTEESMQTLNGGYLLKGETPKQMYKRVANASALRLKKPELAEVFFDLMWKNWLGLASPVAANMGTERGLPISCFSLATQDSINSIMNSMHELAMMSKFGGGVGVHWDKVRPRGSVIGKDNGHSDGVIPFMKIQDSTTIGVSQGCYDEQTEVLTNHGWKYFRDFDINKDLVAQVLENKQISFVKSIDYIKYPVKENLIMFKGGKKETTFTAFVTKNHRMVYESHWAPGDRSRKKTWDNKLRIEEAETIKFHRDKAMHSAGFAIGEKISLTPQERFLIAFQADGSKNNFEKINGNFLVKFHFQKERKIERLKKILTDLINLENLDISFSVYKQKDGTTNISVRNLPSSLLKENFSEWIDLTNINEKWALEFIEEISHWDGSKGKNIVFYCSSNKENVDFAQAVATLGCLRTNIYTDYKLHNDNAKPVYKLTVSKYAKYSGDSISKSEIFYDGMVYCVTVPSGILITRRNNRTLVCGNSTRRGASAAYLPIDHGDIEEFLRMRKPQGDINRQCLNVHHGVCVTDDWMEKMLSGDEKKREIWKEVLKTRYETGEPYFFFTDNANNANPECYKKNNLSVKGSNICCLSGDTMVLTKEGPVRIDALCNKEIELWDGKNWVKNNTISQRGIDKLYRVFLKDGSYIDCNANHRWFAASSYEDIRRNTYKEILTKDLKNSHWLESHNVEFHGNEKVNGAYLKGFLLGDGTSIKDRPILQLHFTKYICEEKLITSANEIKITSTNTNTKTNIEFSPEYSPKKNNAYGIQKLKRMKGLSARKEELYPWSKQYKEKLPNSVFFWEKESKLNLLAGLFDADGTLSRGCLQLSSINKEFIFDIQKILKTFGFSGSIDSVSFDSRKKLYRLTVSSYDSFELLKMMDCKRIQKLNKKANRKLTGWRKVLRIEELKGEHPVYCPTLPTTGKFALSNGLMTGNTEIFLHTDEEHSFVCCLSSMNLARYDEWKDTDAVYWAIWFLDGVMQEFIEKAKQIPGFEKSVRFAEKGRALGLGVFGFHTLLQRKEIPYDCMETFQLNAQIFRGLKKESERATKDLAEEYGEPEWCKGFNRRNTHLIALAPTVSNSIISGNVSPSIEPWTSNAFARKTAKGTFIHRNRDLENLLEDKGKNTEDIWKSIVANNGSVQHLEFLSEKEKETYQTAREINQFVIIKLAGQRQKWIDQGQSINLFFPSNVDPVYFHKIHIAAWTEGLKSLYYCRTESPLKGEMASRNYERQNLLNSNEEVVTKKTEVLYSRSENECKACEG